MRRKTNAIPSVFNSGLAILTNLQTSPKPAHWLCAFPSLAKRALRFTCAAWLAFSDFAKPCSSSARSSSSSLSRGFSLLSVGSSLDDVGSLASNLVIVVEKERFKCCVTGEYWGNSREGRRLDTAVSLLREKARPWPTGSAEGEFRDDRGGGAIERHSEGPLRRSSNNAGCMAYLAG